MIPLFKTFVTQDAANASRDTLLSGYLTQGPKVQQFESELAKYLGYKYGATVNNATAGLHLALRLAGVKTYSQVITTPLTCFATNAAVLGSHASPLWADVDPSNCNIDINDVVNKVSEDTYAIVCVHWAGVPVDVVSMRERVTQKLGYCPPIIEDCAHAFGGTYKGGQTKIGASGNFCSFSFQAIKHLTTGDGGLLTVPAEEYRRAKLLRWYGIDREGDQSKKKDFRSDIPVHEWGYKYHMNDVCASIGIENLKVVEEKVVQVCKDNARYYTQELQGVDGVELCEVPEGADPSYWLYTIKVDNRDGFRDALRDKGIVASKVHDRNDKHPCVQRFRVDLPQLDSIEDRYICIPVGWWVTPEDREYIVQSIKEGWT